MDAYAPDSLQQKLVSSPTGGTSVSKILSGTPESDKRTTFKLLFRNVLRVRLAASVMERGAVVRHPIGNRSSSQLLSMNLGVVAQTVFQKELKFVIIIFLG